MTTRERVRRLVCRLHGHDDVVGVVAPDFGAAVLDCERCGRPRLVPLRCAVPAPAVPTPAAASSVVTVDRSALELLQCGAEVNGALLTALLRREGWGG